MDAYENWADRGRRYRVRAEEMKARAEKTRDLFIKDSWLGAAAHYEFMAKRAEIVAADDQCVTERPSPGISMQVRKKAAR